MIPRTIWSTYIKGYEHALDSSSAEALKSRRDTQTKPPFVPLFSSMVLNLSSSRRLMIRHAVVMKSPTWIPVKA